MLAAHGIQLVADVRRLPGSKRYPHFNAGALADSLGAHAIRYQHFPELAGDGNHGPILATRPGATMRSAVMPITWKATSSRPASNG